MAFKMDKMSGRIGVLSGVAVSSSVFISFLYDWGFLFALGITFAEAPTTISDHIRSWLVWLTGATIIVFIIWIVVSVSSYADKIKGYEIIKSFHTYYVISLIYFLLVLFISLNSTYIPLSEPFIVAGILLFILNTVAIVLYFLLKSSSILRNKIAILINKIKDEISVFRFCSYVFFILVPVVFFLGYISAKISDTESSTSYYRIYEKNTGNDIECIDVEFLRSFGEWLLIRVQDKNIFWIRLADISRIELRRTSFRSDPRCHPR